MKQQRGGTLIGFILGLIVGLALALGVAVYVTKVPIPFMNKGQMRSADQDEAEARRNKDWDPNAPLQGKNPARAQKADAAASAVSPSTPAPETKATSRGAVLPESKASDAAKSAVRVPATKPDARATSADPLGDLARAKSAASDAVSYFVQVGAYRSLEDAEAQRAKLSLDGIETRITEREQSGRMVYRVRTGPFDSKEAAERSKAALEQAGLSASLVRVQPSP